MKLNKLSCKDVRLDKPRAIKESRRIKVHELRNNLYREVSDIKGISIVVDHVIRSNTIVIEMTDATGFHIRMRYDQWQLEAVRCYYPNCELADVMLVDQWYNRQIRCDDPNLIMILEAEYSLGEIADTLSLYFDRYMNEYGKVQMSKLNFNRG